jgi:peroxiredoxin
VADRPEYTHRRERHGLVGPFSGRQLALALGSVVVAALVLIAITTPLGKAGAAAVADPRQTPYVFRSAVPGLEVGALAPEFGGALPDGTTYQLTDLDGKPVRLSDLRGKAVWVNFWASWCPPCQQETPIIRELSDTYRDRGLAVVAIEVQETADEGRRYADKYGLRYTIGADVSGNVFRAYHVFALPTQFFVGPDGVIRSVIQGPLAKDAAASLIESILPSQSGSSAAPPSAVPSTVPPTAAPSGSRP